MSQFLIGQGLIEYMMSASVLFAFAFTCIFGWLSRASFLGEMKRLGVNRYHIAIAILVVALFVSAELAVVKPTQQLFFDDGIYQGMALDLIHTGQAWMCNYGTPSYCISGQIFHEPVGEAFNIAIAFLALGVHRYSAYAANFTLSAVAVLLTFFVALLLLEDKKAALFSESIMALTPILLVWAMPTTSDIPMLTYSLIAIFCMLLFTKSKNIYTFGLMLSSMALLVYMKVDAVLFVPLIIISYIILDNQSISTSIKVNAALFKKNLFNTKLLLVLLVVVLIASTEVVYASYEVQNSGFGASSSSGVNVPESCNIGHTVAYQKFSFDYFRANICGNILFWFNSFAAAQIVQPLVFTTIGIFGAAVMAIIPNRRRALLFLGLWFLLFFMVYTFFYAGGVMYGVDWRFMLSIIPPVAIFGGFFLSLFTGFVEKYSYRASIKQNSIADRKRLAKAEKSWIAIRGRHAKKSVPKKGRPIAVQKRNKIIWLAFSIVVGAVIIGYPAYQQFPIIGVNPAQIQQAGNARYYENFVYNSSYLIPRGCIVLSFDPELFNLNGLNSSQMSYYSNGTVNGNSYRCVVVDYGFWCYAGYSGTCNATMNGSIVQTIASSTYRNGAQTTKYGFYRILGQKQTSS